MVQDLCKASFWKRISAFLVDTFVLAIFAIVCGVALAGVFHPDKYNEAVQEAYTRYETDYNISFELTQEEYESMSTEEKERFDEAYGALIADQEVMYAYNMTIYLSIMITALALLIAATLLEFVGPMMLGNGQTLGKKIFGLGVMRIDGMRLTTSALLARTFIGKLTIEIMIPVLLILMMFFQIIGVTGVFLLGGVLLLQVVLLGSSKINAAIHDRLAGTVVIDIASQRIFATREEMMDYKKKMETQAQKVR